MYSLYHSLYYYELFSVMNLYSVLVGRGTEFSWLGKKHLYLPEKPPLNYWHLHEILSVAQGQSTKNFINSVFYFLNSLSI